MQTKHCYDCGKVTTRPDGQCLKCYKEEIDNTPLTDLKDPNPHCKICGGGGSILIRKQVWVWDDENCSCMKVLKRKQKGIN